MTPYQNLLLAWAIDGIPEEKQHPDDKTYPKRLIEALELYFRSAIGGGAGAWSPGLTIPLFNVWTRFTDLNPVGGLIVNRKGDHALIVDNDYKTQTWKVISTYNSSDGGRGSMQHTLFLSEMIRDEWRSLATEP